ncbi:ArnT family glycosyltransferase [Sphaerisporangium aureirubrum]|uniref:ArnT family glycosyltransferase n=1 Tax=Sphaerisporangium aureirubrum TaxID=1544736 RepID=A0ABW1NKS3_9ACTN
MGTSTVPAEAADTAGDAVAPVPWRVVLGIAGALGAVLVAVSARYGFHGDELYFLVAGRHLDWGYPDQPPLVPLIMRGVTEVFGPSIVAVRVVAAAVAAAGVVVAALTAREMGGTRRAQVLTAGAYAVCPFTVANGHTLYTSSVDLFVTTTLVWVVIRWVRTRDHRLLLAAGAIAGVASQVKYLVVIVLLAIVAGIVISGPREVFRRPVLYAGTAVAVAAAVPGFVWQYSNGWPQLAMARAIAADDVYGGPAGFLVNEFLMTGIVLSVLAVWGVWGLLRSPELRPFRFLALAFLLLTVFFMATGGKPYYLAGLWAAMWAAGAVWAERRQGRSRWGWVTSAPVFLVTATVSVLMTLPVYPVDTLARTPQPLLNPEGAETVGWPRLTAQVARVYRSLPPAERARTTILAADYSLAGALDLYGRPLGLPTVHSAHTGFWYFGRPATDGGTTIAVGFDKDDIDWVWTRTTHAATLDNGVGLNNRAQGRPVWICRGQRYPWSVLWPRFKSPLDS